MERRPVLPWQQCQQPCALLQPVGRGWSWPCREENKDDERFLALGLRGHLRDHSLFRKPPWDGQWYSSSLGTVLLEHPGVVLLKQHGVVLLRQHEKVLLQLHWMILPKQPGEVLLEQFGVLLMKQGGMVLLYSITVVLLGWSCSGSMAWPCLSTVGWSVWSMVRAGAVCGGSA